MRTFENRDKNTSAFARTMCAAIALLLLPALNSAAAQDRMVTEDTLLDRIQIEDLLARYYFDLMAGSGDDLSEYYTEDAVLDVNGTIARGHEEIRALYGSGDDADDNGEEREGRAHMLMTNPIINVDGDTATAWVIWTGVMNDDIKEPPELFEQGREQSELVKQDGRWLIETRYISADSGMPDRWDSTYEPRTHR